MRITRTIILSIILVLVILTIVWATQYSYESVEVREFLEPRTITQTTFINATFTREGRGSVAGGNSWELVDAVHLGPIKAGSQVSVKVMASAPVLVLITDELNARLWDLFGVYEDKYVLASGVGTDVEVKLTIDKDGNYSVTVGKTAGNLGATFVVRAMIVGMRETIVTITTDTVITTTITTIRKLLSW